LLATIHGAFAQNSPGPTEAEQIFESVPDAVSYANDAGLENGRTLEQVRAERAARIAAIEAERKAQQAARQRSPDQGFMGLVQNGLKKLDSFFVSKKDTAKIPKGYDEASTKWFEQPVEVISGEHGIITSREPYQVTVGFDKYNRQIVGEALNSGEVRLAGKLEFNNRLSITLPSYDGPPLYVGFNKVTGRYVLVPKNLMDTLPEAKDIHWLSSKEWPNRKNLELAQNEQTKRDLAQLDEANHELLHVYDRRPLGCSAILQPPQKDKPTAK